MDFNRKCRRIRSRAGSNHPLRACKTARKQQGNRQAPNQVKSEPGSYRSSRLRSHQRLCAANSFQPALTNSGGFRDQGLRAADGAPVSGLGTENLLVARVAELAGRVCRKSLINRVGKLRICGCRGIASDRPPGSLVARWTVQSDQPAISARQSPWNLANRIGPASYWTAINDC